MHFKGLVLLYFTGGVCGMPSVDNNTMVIGSAYRVGDTVQFKCKEGYKSTRGNTTAVCGDDQMWSGTHLLCESEFFLRKSCLQMV